MIVLISRKREMSHNWSFVDTIWPPSRNKNHESRIPYRKSAARGAWCSKYIPIIKVNNLYYTNFTQSSPYKFHCDVLHKGSWMLMPDFFRVSTWKTRCQNDLKRFSVISQQLGFLEVSQQSVKVSQQVGKISQYLSENNETFFNLEFYFK